MNQRSSSDLSKSRSCLGQEHPCHVNHISRNTFTCRISRSNKSHQPWHMTHGNLVRRFLDFDFLMRSEFRSSHLHHQLSSSLVSYANVWWTVDYGCKFFCSSDNLISFISTNITSIANNLHTWSNLSHLCHNPSNLSQSSNLFCLNISHSLNCWFCIWSWSNC